MPEKNGSVTLPGWFIWVFTLLGVPCVLGAVPWAYSVQMNLTEINVNLQHIQKGEAAILQRVVRLEDDLDAHQSDTTIHKYGLDNLRGELTRLEDRVERLENED